MAHGVSGRTGGAVASCLTMTVAVSPTRRDLAVPDAEFAFTWSDFRQISALVHADAGIVLGEAKVNLVYSRLAKRLRTIGLRSFRDYCEFIASTDGVDERQAMIAAMTTNVTRFFREPHHFDYLSQHIMPILIGKLQAGERVRLWSAGCSSGQEPYSIALTVLAAIPDAAKHDLLILASDIDPHMIARGRAASYPLGEAREIPADIRVRWTRNRNTESIFTLAPEVQSLVRFKELNLLGPWPMQGRFDVIFCRNVMIYFDETTQSTIWNRFANAMATSGHLCVGHSERINSDRLPFDVVAQTVYRLRSRVEQ